MGFLIKAVDVSTADKVVVMPIIPQSLERFRELHARSSPSSWVGADGVGVKFPIFPGNGSCLPLS